MFGSIQILALLKYGVFFLKPCTFEVIIVTKVKKVTKISVILIRDIDFVKKLFLYSNRIWSLMNSFGQSKSVFIQSINIGPSARIFFSY